MLIRFYEVDNTRLYILAIHPISHTTVSRYAVSKVLDVESSFKPGRKEATEWSHKRCEACHDQKMKLVGCIR